MCTDGFAGILSDSDLDCFGPKQDKDAPPLTQLSIICNNNDYR